MLVHGFLLVHNVGTQVSPTGDGAHGDRPDIFLRLLRCIAPGIIRGSEGRKVIQECLAHGVLRGHCDGFEHRSHHPIWSRQDLERMEQERVRHFWDNADRLEHVSLQKIDPTDKFCDVCSFVGRTVKFLDLER